MGRLTLLKRHLTLADTGATEIITASTLIFIDTCVCEPDGLLEKNRFRAFSAQNLGNQI